MEIKGVLMGEKRSQLSVFVDNMVLYISVVATLGCQLDYIRKQLKPKWEGTPVRGFP